MSQHIRVIHPRAGGPDYVSPLTIQGRGGEKWLDYQSLIEGGATYNDLQDHPFVVKTTAGEDVE